MSTSEKDSTSSHLKSIVSVAIGGLIIFSATTFYTDVWKKPNVIIDLKPIGENNPILKDQIRIENTGRVSANNLRLTLKPDVLITNSSKVFYTENITLNKEGTDLWVTQAKRLAPGATIIIDTVLNSSKSNIKYQIFATYDEGSTEANYFLNTKEEKVTSDPFIGLSNFLSAGWLSFVSGFAAILAPLFIRIYSKRRKKLNKRSYDW